MQWCWFAESCEMPSFPATNERAVLEFFFYLP